MITVVYESTRMIWILPTASKLSPSRIIQFILTTDNNENHPWRCVRVYEDGSLEKWEVSINLPVEEFNITTKTTGGYASWTNGNNDRHIRII